MHNLNRSFVLRVNLKKFTWETHPARFTECPKVDADYATFTEELYFKDKVYMRKRGDGQWEPCLLGECPVTGMLMYMQPYFPIQWLILDDERIVEAYMRYVVERDIIDG